jgi:fumarylacetoacetase
MTWLELAEDEPYGMSALPYGVFRPTRRSAARVGVRVGYHVVDLATVASEVGHARADVFASSSLNKLMELGPSSWEAIRAWIGSLFVDEHHRSVVISNRYPVDEVSMLLPIEVADYVDFYASERHARNVGAIFRPSNPDLPAAWKHLPIGYHGRSGTVVVSGTPVVRPFGQRRGGPDASVEFGPSTRLDIECEVGFVVGRQSALGRPVSVADAEDHIFGVVLLNDWSARDIQAWEYVPLGPFLGKSFSTSISAWVLPWDALRHARAVQPAQDPPVVDYLGGAGYEPVGLDLHLEVAVNATTVSRPEYRAMYWAPAQMIAHLTVNGASLRVGDLIGSGTVSGDERATYGSLLELTWNGTEPVMLEDGTTRGFLDDGDTVVISGWARSADGGRVALGEVTGTIVAAAGP